MTENSAASFGMKDKLGYMFGILAMISRLFYPRVLC